MKTSIARLGMVLSFIMLVPFLGLVSAADVSAESLDQGRVRQLYNDGDFDGVIDLIGRFRSKQATYSRDDSIFIAKHLSVVHAANPKSVGQGKYWMNELLNLMPAADLVGMYVSEEIDRIFEKVRQEFLARQRSFGVDTAGLVLPSRPSSKLPDSAGRRAEGATGPGPDGKPSGGGQAPGSPAAGTLRRTYWILGGTAAAVAAGATAYFLLAASDDPGPTEVFIPKGSE